MQRFANPHVFLKIEQIVRPFLGGLSLVLWGAGLFLALFHSPPDYLQGEMVRVMFIHVPAASFALLGYVFMAFSSALYLIFRHPLASLAAQSAAPLGATFAAIALITGAIWAKPTWGAYWVWDARIISTFVLFLFYLGYLAVWQAFGEWTKASKIAAVVALVGVINVPIVRFSVVWWSTLHQQFSLGFRETTIHISILIPLFVMMLAYGSLFLFLLLSLMRTKILERRVKKSQR